MEPEVVRCYAVLVQHFFPRLGYELAGPRLSPDKVAALAQVGYLSVEAAAPPRGARRRVVALVIPPGSKYLSSELRTLLSNVTVDRPRELARLIVAAPREVLEGRATFADTFAAAPTADAPAAAGADPDGAGVYYDLVKLSMFVMCAPDHRLVPPHRVLPDAEAAEVLAQARCKAADLPRIYWSDPGAFWAGARPGQVVCVTRPSENACFESLTYRLVVPGNPEPLAATASKARAARA